MSNTSNPTNRRRIRRWAAALMALAVLFVSACGASGGNDAGTTADTSTSAPAPAPTEPVDDTYDPASAEVVRAAGELALHEQPEEGAASRPHPAATKFGSPTALLVTDRVDGWVEVLVPGRPVGQTGWVLDADLEIMAVDLEVEIDVAARTLTVTDGSQEVLSTPVAVGSDDAPTPTGRFSVTDKLQSPEANSAYGPYALGLSGRSEVLTEFAGGDGQIGIHGTNDPDSIGQAVSHGCVRVPNDVVTELTRILPLGTPVVIR